MWRDRKKVVAVELAQLMFAILWQSTGTQSVKSVTILSVTSQHHRCNILIIFPSASFSSLKVCGQSNEMESTNFVDSYKHFSHHDSKYGDLLKFLWENPSALGQCIYEGERSGFPGMERIMTTVTASIYGGCMFREDESAMLHILKLLTELQVGVFFVCVYVSVGCHVT